jgi:hypothetical protein
MFFLPDGVTQAMPTETFIVTELSSVTLSFMFLSTTTSPTIPACTVSYTASPTAAPGIVASIDGSMSPFELIGMPTTVGTYTYNLIVTCNGSGKRDVAKRSMVAQTIVLNVVLASSTE